MDREIPASERKKKRLKTIIRIGAGVAVVAVGTVAVGKMMRASISASDLIIGTADTGTIEVTVSGGKVGAD